MAPPRASREPYPARRFQLSNCLVFGFWVKIAKRAGKVRGGVLQKRDVRPRPLFIRISQARSGAVIQISRPLWASKPECDAHICLNLGFTSQNFRLTQVSAHVCYFWSSPFRIDEGNTLPGVL